MEHLAERGRLHVRSAGLLDLDGEPMHPHAREALARAGVVARAHSARELRAHDVESADLVLGMTREHRGRAIQLSPRAASRTFTLPEFGRLCRAVDGAEISAKSAHCRARQGVAAAAARRGIVRPDTPEEDDIADPLGGSIEVFEDTLRQIDEALRAFVEMLVGASDR